MTIYINEYGQIDERGKYKVFLSGGYSWSFVSESWLHDVEKIEPYLPLSKLPSDKLLFNPK